MQRIQTLNTIIIIQDGWTALMHAYDKGHTEIVKYLLDRNDIDVNILTKVNYT